jgi:hypothetical protein
VLFQLGPGHRRPDPPAALLLGDRTGLGNLLDVDDQLRIDDVGAQLDQEIGTPGQHADIAGRSYDQGDRPVQRLWRLVTHGSGLAFLVRESIA